jgi:hypothetical protein
MTNTPKPQANTLDEILHIDNILAGTEAKLTEIGYEVLGENITEATQAIEALITEARIDQVKKPILEYQANELEGKGYDFYFALRRELDRLTQLKENK